MYFNAIYWKLCIALLSSVFADQVTSYGDTLNSIGFYKGSVNKEEEEALSDRKLADLEAANTLEKGILPKNNLMQRKLYRLRHSIMWL